MNQPNRKPELVKALSELTDRELVELFYEVSNARRNTDYFHKAHLTLVKARIIETGEELIPEWYTEFLCIANPEEYPSGWVNDAPLCQSGTCPKCNSECISYAKEAICSVCETPVYCT